MKFLLLLCACFLLHISSATAQDKVFQLQFEWGDIPLCTNGKPNIVPSPDFTLHNIPPGTRNLYFKLVDLDAPKYDHGSAWIPYQRKNIIPSGKFEYKSPCPPKGVHSYQWVVIADKDQDLKNGYIAMTSTRRDYPEE